MLLSIVILSYNRPVQLLRIFQSLEHFQSHNIQVVVKDDLSPSLHLIEALCVEWESRLNFPLHLHVNSCNLGYDQNLLSSFDLVDSEFIFLLSDDDYINPSGLASAIAFIGSSNCNLIISPYLASDGVRRTARKQHALSPRTFRYSIVYDSILFSGLIFRRSFVSSLTLDREFLASCIYTQVYLACCASASAFGFDFSPEPAVVVGGDGDNFFGRNQSAFDVPNLSNRTSPAADLRYHSYLLSVVCRFSRDYSIDYYSSFLVEYRKRLFGHVLRARARGLSDYRSFLKYFLLMSPSPPLLMRSFAFAVLFFPSFLARFLYRILSVSLNRPG